MRFKKTPNNNIRFHLFARLCYSILVSFVGCLFFLSKLNKLNDLYIVHDDPSAGIIYSTSNSANITSASITTAEISSPIKQQLAVVVIVKNPTIPKKNPLDNNNQLRDVVIKNIEYDNNDNINKKLTSTITLPRVIGIVFPQYHQDPLNDALWGIGFTDWTNLNKAPERNYYNLSIPRPLSMEDGGLGFYNYIDIETRKKQGELAKQHHIDGFMYHHYWFYDPNHLGPTLHKPLINMLLDGYPDIPFFFNWCADSWTRTWTGNNTVNATADNMLQKQYFPKTNSLEVRAHYDWLKQFFLHHNYIKVGKRPVMLLYKISNGALRILKQLSLYLIQDGYEPLYIMQGMHKVHDDLFSANININDVATNPTTTKSDPIPEGIDRIVPYPYHMAITDRKTFVIPDWCRLSEQHDQHDNSAPLTNITTYEVPTILTSFDNTPRRTYETATLWSADIPDIVIQRFYQSLYTSIYYETCCFTSNPNDHHLQHPLDERFILINSMNEWAEGMALEPSDVFGFRLLEAIRDAKHVILSSQCIISNIHHKEQYVIDIT